MKGPRTSSKRRWIYATLTGVAVAATLAFGVASPFASPGKRPAVTRIHLIEREVAESTGDVGPSGPSPGDQYTITSDILRPGSGVIGRGDFDCSQTAVGARAGGVCAGVLTLPDGQLTGEFAYTQHESGDIEKQAITGGTGRYSGARGQFVVKDGPPSRTPFTVELAR